MELARASALPPSQVARDLGIDPDTPPPDLTDAPLRSPAHCNFAVSMGRSAAQVPPSLPVERLVAERVLLDGQRSRVIADAECPLSLVTLQDIASIPAERREALTVGEVMRPWAKVITAEPQAPLLEALQAMDDADVAPLPVVRPDGTPVRLLAREQAIHYLRLRPVPPGGVSSGRPPGNRRGAATPHTRRHPAPRRCGDPARIAARRSPHRFTAR